MGVGELIVKTPGTCGGRARLAGHRVPVSSVYRWFLNGLEPEAIAQRYESVQLAEIYAAIAYALANRDEVMAEIAEEDALERSKSQAEASSALV